METNPDLLHAFDRTIPTERGTVRSMSWLALLALAGLVLAALYWGHPGTAANTGTVAYCVTEQDSPASPLLRTALLTAGKHGLKLVANGVTAANGCGQFDYVPLDTGYYVSAWSDDSKHIADSPWFVASANTIVSTIHLDEPGAAVRLALH